MSKEKEKLKPKTKLSILSRGWVEIAAAIFLGLGLIGFGIGGYALYINGPIDPNAKFDLDDLSNFGGLIAGLSGFFTLGSVLLFYRALGLQREDIRVNLDELSQTREVFLEQSNTQKLQQFESTFTLLLGNLNNEREKLRNKFLSANYADSEQRESFFWWNANSAIEMIHHKCIHINLGLLSLPESEIGQILDVVDQYLKKEIIDKSENFKLYLLSLELLIDYTITNKVDNLLYLRILKSGIGEWELKWLFLFSYYYSNKKSEYDGLSLKFQKLGLFESYYLKESPFDILINYYNRH